MSNRIDPKTGHIILPPSSASHGLFAPPQIIDKRAQFDVRLHDHQRANSPRAERLRAVRSTLLASHHDIIEDLGGVVALVIIIIILATLS